VKEIFCQEVGDINSSRIQFHHGNALEYDFSDADVVFAATTCFSNEMMAQLSKKAELLKEGAKVITLTNRLNSIQFKLIETNQWNYGHGTVLTYYVYQKLSNYVMHSLIVQN